MAVEAHRLHLFPSQLIRNRVIMNAMESQGDAQMGYVVPLAPHAPFYTAASAAAAESGVTFNDLPTRKRRQVSFLGEDLSSHVQQQQLDVDRLITNHVEKVRAEVMERRKRFSRQILAAVEEGVARRLRAKEEEIERIGKLNWALEERVRSLCVENEIWRNLAQSNEAAANVLRSNLEHVLAAQQQQDGAQSPEAEDAESCCGGADDVDGRHAGGEAAEVRPLRLCRMCERHEPSVLLLPCRHLCVCAACAPEITACPVCKCARNGSVNVNMS